MFYCSFTKTKKNLYVRIFVLAMFNNFDFSSPWSAIQNRGTSRTKASKNQPSLAMPSSGSRNEATGAAAVMVQGQQPGSIASVPPAAAAMQQQLQVQQIVVRDQADVEVSQLTSSLGIEDAFMELAQPRSTATPVVNVAADSALQTPRSSSARMVRTSCFESSGVLLNPSRSSSRPPSRQNGNLNVRGSDSSINDGAIAFSARGNLNDSNNNNSTAAISIRGNLNNSNNNNGTDAISARGNLNDSNYNNGTDAISARGNLNDSNNNNSTISARGNLNDSNNNNSTAAISARGNLNDSNYNNSTISARGNLNDSNNNNSTAAISARGNLNDSNYNNGTAAFSVRGNLNDINTNNNLFGDDEFNDFDDDDFEEHAQSDNRDPSLFDNDSVIPETQATTANADIPQDFEGVDPDYIMDRTKLIRPDILTMLKMKPFYKSYSSWEKLSADQKNKALSFFRKLPAALRGMDKFLDDDCI